MGVISIFATGVAVVLSAAERDGEMKQSVSLSPPGAVLAKALPESPKRALAFNPHRPSAKQRRDGDAFIGRMGMIRPQPIEGQLPLLQCVKLFWTLLQLYLALIVREVRYVTAHVSS